MKVLIAEDEAPMRKIIRMYLEREGYEVDVAADGREALEKLCEGGYDLLIADWMMPGMDGVRLCREARGLSIPVKIIMLTAKGDARDEIAGLTGGADDYIRKPFEPRILLLRIQKLLKTEGDLRCGRLVLDQKSRAARFGAERIRLTQKEWKLLEVFMRNQGITLSRDVLLERVWGSDYDGDERTLDTHIRRLRGKIGKGYITTQVGLGYRMEEPDE